jgi:hypothetical protein
MHRGAFGVNLDPRRAAVTADRQTRRPPKTDIVEVDRPERDVTGGCGEHTSDSESET